MNMYLVGICYSELWGCDTDYKQKHPTNLSFYTIKLPSWIKKGSFVPLSGASLSYTHWMIIDLFSLLNRNVVCRWEGPQCPRMGVTTCPHELWCAGGIPCVDGDKVTAALDVQGAEIEGDVRWTCGHCIVSLPEAESDGLAGGWDEVEAVRVVLVISRIAGGWDGSTWCRVYVTCIFKKNKVRT